MVQIEEADYKIEIEILHFNDNYVGWIKGDNYAGIVVDGKTIGDCMKELSTSLIVLERYRKNIEI